MARRNSMKRMEKKEKKQFRCLMNEVPVEGSPIGSKGTMRKLTRKEYLSESVIDSTHTFVTSDHHFWSCRHPFQKLTTREEDDAHIALWNQVVGKDDLVLYVGDFCDSGRVVDLAALVGRLNGRKILVKGNHEQRLLDLGLIGEEVYRMAFDDVVDELDIPEWNVVLMHSPMVRDVPRGGRLIHGHVHEVTEDYPTFSDRSFCCCAMRHSWKPVRLSEALRAMEEARLRAVSAC